MHLIETRATYCRIRIVIPRGSLFKPVSEQFKAIGARLQEPDRAGFCGCGFEGGYENVEIVVRDRRMIPQLVGHGMFDAGITGLDILVNSGIRTRIVGRLREPESKWVLASKCNWLPRSDGQSLIGAELRKLARKILANQNGLQRCQVTPIEGFEEQAIDDGLCEAVFIVSCTGKSLRESNLAIYPGCEELFKSFPVLFLKRNADIDVRSTIADLSRRLCIPLTDERRSIAH